MIQTLMQDKGKPSFPNMLWSKPENRTYAGRILILGGSSTHFNNTSLVYSILSKEVINSAQICLPDSLKKRIGPILKEAYYLPSNPSGGLAKDALDEIISLTKSYDHTLICGDLGSNSETEILIEQLLEKTDNWITLSGDSINLLYTSAAKILSRGRINLVIDFRQLQKLFTLIKSDQAITSTMPINKFNEVIGTILEKYNISLVTTYEDKTIFGYGPNVGISKNSFDVNNLAVKTSVWIMQNPDKIFESLGCATYELIS